MMYLKEWSDQSKKSGMGKMSELESSKKLSPPLSLNSRTAMICNRLAGRYMHLAGRLTCYSLFEDQ